MTHEPNAAEDAEKKVPETRDVVHGAFSCMREYASLAGSIPHQEYEYHTAFPGFTRHVEEQSRSLEHIMGRCFALLPQRRRPSLPWSSSEEKTAGKPRDRLSEGTRTLVMEAIDSMLENVDSILDEIKGNKMQKNAQLDMTFGSELVPSAEAALVNALTGVVQVTRVIRPQLTFKTAVDNSFSPFVPVYSDAAGAQHVGVAGVHPFQEDIRNFSPSAAQLQPKVEVAYVPLDQCPLYFVDTVDSLKRAAQELLKVDEIAVDLEHHDFYSFLGFTCLMQISTRAVDYIIDCLKLREEMKLLAPVFLNPSILKVFHGAREDVRWLQKDFSLYLINFFDTGIALQTLHMPYSLAFAVDHFCQVKLDKKYQTADWRVRPLPAEMVHYARQDTHFLLYVYDRLKAMLLNAESRASVGNLLLHVYNASKSLSLELYVKPVLDPDHSYARSLDRSLGGLNSAQRRVAQLVYNWRDRVAREVDDSPLAVLHQSSLLTIASKVPQTAKELLQCANPVSAILRKNVSELVAGIRDILSEEGISNSGASGATAGLPGGGPGALAWHPMGVYRPMTGTCPSLTFPAVYHPSLTFAAESPPEEHTPPTHCPSVADTPPSSWMIGMRRVAERLQRRQQSHVPLPGADVLEAIAHRTEHQTAAPDTMDTVSEPAPAPQEISAPSSRSPSLSATSVPASTMTFPEEAVSLRQRYGLGPQNRRKANRKSKRSQEEQKHD